MGGAPRRAGHLIFSSRLQRALMKEPFRLFTSVTEMLRNLDILRRVKRKKIKDNKGFVPLRCCLRLHTPALHPASPLTTCNYLSVRQLHIFFFFCGFFLPLSLSLSTLNLEPLKLRVSRHEIHAEPRGKAPLPICIAWAGDKPKPLAAVAVAANCRRKTSGRSDNDSNQTVC